ncbi:DNA topoisomerase III [Priestia megaterium]|uniref:type IA DNA topoisomerase n=1 Tax=Priestia megaterium TaxID=1404 RepID=UPI0025B0CE8D|nr:type IA DNA topoisomerase [Priestia megaterium]MDN3365501.1 DNA topoisomerase III [Priestia megaterium]
MGTTLVLAEKPSQAAAYAAAFNGTKKHNGYISVEDSRFFDGKAYITWGYGHLVSLCPPAHYDEKWGKWSLESLPIIPNDFELEYYIPPEKVEQFNVVSSLVKKLNSNDTIIIGTDSDREGSLIAWSILEKIGVSGKTIKRLWINSLEVDEIQKGFKNLRDSNFCKMLAESASARQFGDWAVGMNASPLFTLYVQKKIREIGGSSSVISGKKSNLTFSVGRVQTPTLYLIYQRQMEIENFKPKPTFDLLADIHVNNGQFTAKYSGKFDKKEDVQKILRDNNIQSKENTIITKLIKDLKETKSPKLHTLSTLQTKANKKWKYSPSEVLKTLQNLYEKKLTTYPRSDCEKITENEFKYLQSNIDNYKKVAGVEFEVAFFEPRKRFVDGQSVQEHFAIVPTKVIPTADKVNQLNEKEKNIYFEVLLNTLAMFAPNYKYEETNVEIDIKSVLFKAKGKVEVDKGWKALFTNESEEKANKEENPKLPIMTEGENAVADINIKEGVTKAKSPYTAGQLINMMKTCGASVEDEEAQQILKETEGVGTPATRASIIDALLDAGYIEVKKNIVGVTKKGKILCQAVEGSLLSKPDMTAQWEKFLKQIGTGEKTKRTFLNNIERFVNLLVEKAPEYVNGANIKEMIAEAEEESIISTCPVCKTGKFTDKGKFYGCNNYSEGCKASLPKQFAGKNLSENMVKLLLEKGKTNKLKGFKKKDKSGTFDAPLRVDINKESKNLKIGFDFAKK